MTVFHIRTMGNPTSSRDCWGVFVDLRDREGFVRQERVYGPANLYDCCRERARAISTERHGETVRLAAVE